MFDIFSVSATILAILSVCLAMETTVEEIMNYGDSCDVLEVSVTGTVSSLKFKTLQKDVNNYKDRVIAAEK